MRTELPGGCLLANESGLLNPPAGSSWQDHFCRQYVGVMMVKYGPRKEGVGVIGC